MNIKNSKNLLLVAVAVCVIVLSLISYIAQDYTLYTVNSFSNLLGASNESNVNELIDTQNNILTNYVNSLYNSQVSNINLKYNSGSLSLEEKNKQLNAVLKNRDMTISALNKIDHTKKDIYAGNITQKDVLIRINSFTNFNSDIKSEINATMNGY